ncbi:peptidylprolyl isomerase [Oleiagrimonas sp.]|jgi:FKBP-type peptidyl-prolyl cis-trans isomerase SlyD|uniref:FKBP-type peptidyl-prolyl cis-trans isomerase n=1 Tax=Oleiagrimonas sp. TaxID=2010330 RepID=UPI00262798C7|nr:peptidylprolyl isomerase [Oleiagrimonas sp.]MDA3915315.1 peptidylprolyl isomerase [Oleiagrimonas sp.]
MKADKDQVVSFHYVLSTDGAQVESSRDNGEPLQVLLGRGQLIAGMEKAMQGHAAGDAFAVDLAPEEAYGERHEGRTQRMSKKYFQQAARLKPGMTTVLQLKEGGQRQVTVHKVGMTTIDVDLNHPLAGKTLHFDIEMIDVRPATPEELEHGHAHGPGGHAH